MARLRSSRPAYGVRGTKPEPDVSRRRAGTQRAILAAAARLVRRLGYNRVTIEAVAAEAGAGKQTIYRWWKTKAALFAELLGESGPAPSGRPTRRPPSPLTELRTAAVALARSNASPLRASVYAGLIAEAAGNRTVAALIQTRLVHAQTDALKATLARARTAGMIRRNADIGLAAEQIVAGLWFRGVVSAQRADRRYADRLVAQIVRGLRP
jgi:AcrR family transcriptional regulator